MVDYYIRFKRLSSKMQKLLIIVVILIDRLQACQGPEMKMRETVRHSGEGAILFFGGVSGLSGFNP